jgi:hypothetical protein
MAPVTSLGSYDIGGIWDTAQSRFAGYSKTPKIWYASEKAIGFILHADELPDSLLAEGAMGSGKTIGILAKWEIVRALELAKYAPIEIGGTSPTDPRLEEYVTALQQAMRPGWYVYNEKKKLFQLRCGVRIRLVGTAKRSASQGSKVQGWNWAACGSDELQDSAEENDNIDMRGRRAPGGRYKRLGTATVKADSVEWEEVRDLMLTSGEWALRRFEGPANPFVWPEYWEKLKRKLSPQAYAEKVLAIFGSRKHGLYPSWSREHNLRPIPRIGARDVTAQVLAPYGSNLEVLVGFDPGTIQDVSILLKAFQLRGERRHSWWVVGELTTERSSTDEHCIALLKLLRSKWGCNELDRKGNPIEHGRQCMVRADPYGDTDTKPDRSIYTVFKGHNFYIRPAAYSKTGKGPGRVPKEPRIEMVDSLLCNAADERWLFVDCDDRRQPVAPNLVKAFKKSKRDDAGRAEMEKKNQYDLSHWPCATGYALWMLERPRLEQLRQEIATR